MKTQKNEYSALFLIFVLSAACVAVLHSCKTATTKEDHFTTSRDTGVLPAHGRTGSLRIYPYLLEPSAHSIRINFFTTRNEKGILKVVATGSKDTLKIQTTPVLKKALAYSDLEISEKENFPDMFPGENYKHSTLLDSLDAKTDYTYSLKLRDTIFEGHFKTAPQASDTATIRFIALADSETDPEGRTTFRKWKTGVQTPSSTGRPQDVKNYLVTEFEGFRQNLKFIKERKPDFIVLPGDIVQGGGYQRAWDEFFFQTAGKYGQILCSVPLIPAVGNWEDFGARNGGYQPEAVAASRAKYASYFDAPANNNPDYRNFYYRIDDGPVTILTLDSSNGLPDSTDVDTNININASTYPGNDLPDINPGSDQWKWTEAQLKDAHRKGQLIFVQFHHIPYSSGGHSLPLTAKGSSGQAGIPMRVYTPLFKKYGVAAVLCGHNESFEHSVVEGIHFYDVGVAGDGLGYSVSDIDPRRENPYRRWVAHVDAPEEWKGKQLIDGGKHYGHLEIEVKPLSNGSYHLRFTPVYIFPVTDEAGKVTGFERRIYGDVTDFIHPLPGNCPC